MPLNIKTVVMKYKNGNSYKTVDAITDAATEDRLAEINAEGAEQVAAVEAAGLAAKESIRDSINSVDATAVASTKVDPSASFDNETGVLSIEIPRGPKILSISEGVQASDDRTVFTMTFEGVGDEPGETFDFYTQNGIGKFNTICGLGPGGSTGTDLEKERLLKLIYPKGSVYMTESNESIYTIFGVGDTVWTWTRLEGKYIKASDSIKRATMNGITGNPPANTGGEANVTLNDTTARADIGFVSLPAEEEAHRLGLRADETSYTGFTPTHRQKSTAESNWYEAIQSEEAYARNVKLSGSIPLDPEYILVNVWVRTDDNTP